MSYCEVRHFTRLAGYYRHFAEGYSEDVAQLTALGSTTAQIVWTHKEQASFDVLKLARSYTPVLRTFKQARRTVQLTNTSNVAVQAILTQPDD